MALLRDSVWIWVEDHFSCPAFRLVSINKAAIVFTKRKEEKEVFFSSFPT